MSYFVIKVTDGRNAQIVSEHERYGKAIEAWQVLDDERLAQRLTPGKLYYAVRSSHDDSGLVETALFGGREEDFD